MGIRRASERQQQNARGVQDDAMGVQKQYMKVR